jgi:hypothetical protein
MLYSTAYYRSIVHHHLAVKMLGHLLTRSTLSCTKFYLKGFLGAFICVVCNILIVWEFCLFAFCQHVGSVLCILKFCPI